MNLSGMTEVYKYLTVLPPKSITQQYNIFENLNKDQLIRIQEILFKISSEKNDVLKSTSTVLSELVSA
jgi:hypothetical protein